LKMRFFAFLFSPLPRKSDVSDFRQYKSAELG
jgi:hypothetical protein